VKKVYLLKYIKFKSQHSSLSLLNDYGLVKRVFILLYLMFPFIVLSQGSWERISVPTNYNLRALHFTDSLCGWIVGDSGTIIHTDNGGDSWEVQQSPVNLEIVSIFFLNHSLGWASAFNLSTPPYGTILLKTVDGGNTWTAEPYPQENIFINNILFLDSLNGWMGGSPHALLRTINGGQSWYQAAIDTSTLAFFPVEKIKFLGEVHGYACGGMFDIAGVIWRTHNGGDMWYAIDVADAPADEVHGLYIFDSMQVIGSSGDADFGYGVGMITTLDGGVSWDYRELGIQGIAYDIDFRDGKEGWAPLGNHRKFIYTLDAGDTWFESPVPDSSAIFRLMFTDSLHGYAIGYEGAVLRFIPPLFPAVPPVGGFEQKYTGMNWMPRPVKGIANCHLNVADYGWGLLEITDLLGKPLIRLANREFSPGEYTYVFDMDILHSGMYFARLLFTSHKDGRAIMTIQKLVLVK